MIRLALGDLRVSVLSAGSLWLDGGAMFGVVPRVLWERERPPDDCNRIHLAMNVLLVEDGRRTVLVDTGAGTKWDQKHRDMFGIDGRTPEELLEPAGLRPDRVDWVVLSHLHFDHAGGCTVFSGGGEAVPAFPNATYVVQRGELGTARWNHERTRASYLRDDFEPLVREGRLRTVDGEDWLLPWLGLERAPGHTPHMQVARIRSGGRSLLFLADLVPTTSHVPIPFVMGYDLEPLSTVATKKKVLGGAFRDGSWLVFEHDTECPVGELVERDGRLAAVPVETE